jgi:hypothetical protein
MKSLTIFTTASQRLAARLFSRGRTQADKQRGASALEYVMLAAVLVGILAFVATQYGGEDNPIVNIFNDLFGQAENTATNAGAGGGS